MRVASIRYRPIEGGALGGHYALHVTLGGSDAPKVFSVNDLAAKIKDCFDKLAIRSPIKAILLDCRGAELNNDEMASLLGLLQDWGLFISTWVDESTRHPWFDKAGRITVFVRSQHWPNFKVQEVRYVPTGEWKEPDIYEGNAPPNALLYIVDDPRLDNGKLLAFITECRHPWGLASPVRRPSIDFKLE